jgi:hypothetical protein
MADFNYDEYSSGFESVSGLPPGLADKARRWINISGAVCSVSLVLALAVWGYKLAVRDVTGIPVMRAVAGAMRIAPADPGGEQALNQGLTVNAIAAMGTSAAPADQITLAPQAVTLQDGDAAPAVVQAAAAASDAQPVAEDLAGVVPADPEEQPVASGPAIVPSDPNAIRVSLRPPPRPDVVPVKIQTVSAKSLPAAKEIDPANIAKGTRLAQLGAFETPDLAREKFTELQGSFAELMAGKDIVIQSAQSGGHTFYRLRAHGFDNDDDARRFCAALQAEETDCIPVAQR